MFDTAPFPICHPADVRAAPSDHGHPISRKTCFNACAGWRSKQQRNFVQTFLSLREAATRFSAPVSAVAAVYQHLGEEGIFSSVRGSHTKLLSRGKTRSLKVRGLIAMPASMWRFHTFVDHQRCFRRVRDELHARGFFTTTLFFERSDEERTVVLD